MIGRSFRAALVFVLALGSLGVTHEHVARINLDVEGADLGAVVAMLAAQAHRNIVLDASVKATPMTIHLRHVTFEQALAAIAASHGLQVRLESGVLILGDAQVLNREPDAGGSPYGTHTLAIHLVNARPSSFAKELSVALPSGTVIIPDDRTNTVIISGDPDSMSRAKMLAHLLDGGASAGTATGAMSVYRMRWLRASSALKRLGSLIPPSSVVADDAQNAVILTAGPTMQARARKLLASIDVEGAQVQFEVKVADMQPLRDESNIGIEFGGIDLSGKPLGGSTTYSFANRSIPINATLNALISEGRASILATPRLTTLNNKEADLLIGETYPIVSQTSAFGAQQVQYVDIGVKLRLTPTIGADGSITAQLHPEYSELLGVTDGGYPIIANRKIDSTLRVHDGQTIVLGGLLRDVSAQTITRVPWLSDIPILGRFFKNKRSSHERDEIVFLITPHILPRSSPAAR